MSRKKDTAKAQPKRVDRILLALLSLSCVSLLVWAILGSLLAMHFHERAKMAKIDLEDERAIVKELRSDIALERTDVREDLVNANMLRREVGNLFRELLMKDQRPKSMNELLSRFQKVFSQLSGETLSRLEMIAIRDALSSLTAKASVPTAAPALDAAGIEALLSKLIGQGLITESDRERVESLLLGEPVPAPEKEPPALPAPLAKPTPAPTPVPPKAPVEKIVPVPAPAPPTATPVAVHQGGGWKTHEDKANAYSLRLPETWTIRSEANVAGLVAVSPRTDIRQLYTAYAALNVSPQNNPEPLETFYARSAEHIEAGLIHHERVAEQHLQLSGEPARMLHLKHFKLGQPFHSQYYFVQHKGKSYVLSFTTPEENLETFHHIFNAISASLRLL